MRIRITAADPMRLAWFNAWVGEELDAIGVEGEEYVVDLARVAGRGGVPRGANGRVFVPVAFAELQQAERVLRKGGA